MFTNEQVRTAMEGLVKQKGENHTSFGRYADPETGQGACFLGALAQFMGRAVPEEGTSAPNILGRKSVSPSMEVAFSVAQSLNDSHFEWKYILKAVDMVTAMPEDALFRQKKSGCPCGCTATTPDIARIMDDIRAIRMMDKNRERGAKGPLANGGIITKSMIPVGGKITFDLSGVTALSTAMQEFTISLNSLTTTFSTPAYVPTYVPAQKDHALVA